MGQAAGWVASRNAVFAGGLYMSSVVVRDAHRLCYAPTLSVGAMIGASLSKSVTKHIHTSTIFVDALRAAPRSIHGLKRDTRGARKRVRAPRLIYSALPIVPGRRVRGEGAAPTVRWCCPRTRSMARLQRLQLSAAVSSVKNGAAIYARQTAACPHRVRENAPDGRGFRRRRADDASRQKFSRERDTNEA